MKKSLVLAAAIAAMSAIAIPSMASAANWGPFGTSHTLVGGSVGFTVGNPSSPFAGVSCNTGPTLNAQVTLPALNITSAGNFSCTGWSAFNGCSIAAVPTGLPWTATGPTTSNVTINSINITLTFTSAPGQTCTYNGVKTLSGTLAGGVWNNTTHSVGYTNATGLQLITAGVPLPTSLTSGQLFRDNASPFITLT